MDQMLGVHITSPYTFQAENWGLELITYKYLLFGSGSGGRKGVCEGV